MSSYLHNFGSSPLLHKSLLFPFGKTCSSFENIITHCPVYDAHGCSVKEPGRKWNGNLPFTNKLRLGGFLKVPNQNPPMATLCTECHGHHCPWCSWLFLVWSQLLPPPPWPSLTTPLPPASVLKQLFLLPQHQWIYHLGASGSWCAPG